MKKLIFSTLLIALTHFSSFAQSPEKINYQAVIRDQNNTILSNQSIGYKIVLLQGAPNGNSVYEEAFTLTTSQLGLINFFIGTGNVLSGNFSQIDWGNGPYFVETSLDISGGNNFSVMGTSQLLSVPYSLYSNTSGKADSAVFASTSDSSRYATQAQTAIYADSSKHATHSDTALYALNTTGVSDNYYFQATSGWSGQTIPGTNYTEHAEFGTEVLDPSGSYDPTTSTFTAPQNGIYYFSSFLTVSSSTTNGGGAFIGYIVNNAQFPDPATVPTTVISPAMYTTETVVSVSGMLQLNQGDVVKVGIIGADNGEAFSVSYSGFSGYKIR